MRVLLNSSVLVTKLQLNETMRVVMCNICEGEDFRDEGVRAAYGQIGEMSSYGIFKMDTGEGVMNLAGF